MLFGLFESGSRRHSDQFILGHDIGNRLIELGFKTQVTVGENADQKSVLGNRHPGYPVFLHQLQCLEDLLIGAHGNRVDDHPAFRLLDLVDFDGLLGGVMFLWTIPIPPSRAMQMAERDSVTVSIAAERRGIFSLILGVR
jgi:hypothetical protein